MIKFSDIVRHLSKLLKGSFPTYNIYTEEIIENVKRPAFHINLMPESSSNFNIYYREQACMVDISYFSDEKPDLQSRLKNMDMCNTLQGILNTNLSVLDRKLIINNLTFDIVDRVLHTTFTLLWYNENEVTQAYINQHKIISEVIFNDGFSVIGTNCVLLTADGKYYKVIDGEFYIECTPDEIAKITNI